MNFPTPGTPGPAGQTRNPVMVLLLSMICFVYAILAMLKMLEELKNYLQLDEITPWHFLIPYYNLYLAIVKLPKWVRDAKVKAGCSNQEPANIVLYVFVMPYALAVDLNEIYNPRGLPQTS